MRTVSSMFHKPCSIIFDEDANKEKARITHIFQQNGYQESNIRNNL